MKSIGKLVSFVGYTALISWISVNGWIWWVVGITASLIIIFIAARIIIKHKRKKAQMRKIDAIYDAVSSKEDN